MHPTHVFEKARLDSLREYAPHTRQNDRAMLTIACEATDACRTPIGIVSLMEENEERFLASIGTPLRQLERSVAICAHTILEHDALVVEDLRKDPRFCNLPYVVGEPYVRFYAGAPIFDGTGLPLGTVCVLHTQTHQLPSRSVLVLKQLAEVASAALEARLLLADARVHYAHRDVAKSNQDRLDALLVRMIESRPMCA